MIRSNEITQDFVQINARVTVYGEKPLDELFPKVPVRKKRKNRRQNRQEIIIYYHFNCQLVKEFTRRNGKDIMPGI